MPIEEEGSPPLPTPGNVGRGRGERTEQELRFVCYSLASTLWAAIWKVLNRAHGSPDCVCLGRDSDGKWWVLRGLVET